MQNISNSTVSVRYPAPFTVRLQRATAIQVCRASEPGAASDLILACAEAREAQRAEGFVWFVITLTSLAALGICWTAIL
jgi:hypothetical protein